ncbi:MAG: SDR family oxidoreductase [Deltaproteobacteria bacterium]
MTRTGARKAARAAVVTGGARRIGAAIARRLAFAGFSVVVTYRESRAEAEALAAETGGRACFLDLEAPRGLSRLAGIVETAYGRLDLLVHNAAVFPRTPLGSVTDRDWDRIFAVNVRGPFLLTQRLLPLLRAPRRGGAVVFLGDAGAERLWPAYLPYCLSKLALEAQARAWRTLLSPRVRVGIVRPGLALIPPGFPEEAWSRLRSKSGRPGLDSPAKVAGAVLRFALRGRYN